MALFKILIADDELLIRNFLQDALKNKNFDLVLAKDGKEAIDYLKNDFFDIIITDMKMPIKSGIDVLENAKKLHPSSLVIIMTAHGTIENAVDAMQKGAFTYLMKPFSYEALETILDKAIEHLRLKRENALLRKEIFSTPFIAKSSKMKKILDDLPQIAKSQASVFIYGESGTGKEVVAQTIHHFSLRSERPYVKINCAALPETLLESELFGYEKGAFTGANVRKEGKFEAANKGTILLDEITEIPLSLQPKLLRAIQELEFERIGSNHPIKVDLRFIATSNRNIHEAIKKNIFREDLFFRLNVIPIYLPPLRERVDDILPLTSYFLEKFSLENHTSIKTLLPCAEKKLLSYPWPGNIRELANVIERSVVMKKEINLTAQDIFLDFSTSSNFNLESIVGVSIDEMEKKLIQATLEKIQSRQEAANILGISLKTLQNKIKTFAD